MGIDVDRIARLRAWLAEAGFAEEGVARLLGPGGLQRVRRDPEVQRRRLPPGEPLSVLVELFLLELPVDEGTAARVLGEGLALLEAVGLAEQHGSDVRALTGVFPFQELVLASDRFDALARSEASPSYVGGVTPTSLTLAGLVSREPVASALDVGTGCGVQALLAARHAGRVVATDVNPRALHYGRLNAALNGLENIEWREGSLYEPAAGEHFDRVFCNPPFVISPDRRYAFRDGGLRGHELSRLLVRGAPDRLEEGGFASVLVNWGSRSGESWQDEPRRWLEGLPCDALVLHHRAEDPLDYASGWLQLVRDAEPESYPAALDRWLALYRELGFETIHYGSVVLRRREGEGWVRCEELPAEAVGDGGAALVRLFDAQDFLSGLPDEGALLELPLGVAPHRFVHVEHHCSGEHRGAPARLELEGGLPFAGVVDGPGVEVLRALDGARTLASATSEVAARLGLDERAFAAAFLPIARRFVELGVLVPPV